MTSLRRGSKLRFEGHEGANVENLWKGNNWHNDLKVRMNLGCFNNGRKPVWVECNEEKEKDTIRVVPGFPERGGDLDFMLRVMGS